MNAMTMSDAQDRLLPWILPWLAPLAATLVSWVLSPVLPKANFAMIYLAGVLLTAVSTRVKPALVCALLSFLAYNFFHTEPHFSFLMVHREDILTVSLLILVAVVTGHLAARLREKVVDLEASNRWNHHQMTLAQELSVCVDGPQVVRTLALQIRYCFGFSSMGFYRDPKTNGFETMTDIVQGYSPDKDSLPISGLKYEVTFQEQDKRAQVTFNDQKRNLGLVQIQLESGLTPWQRTRLEGFIDLARLAWSRVQLSESLRQETLVKEREQLRSALLSSISHDLRTPLATMIGSVSSLIDLHDSLDRTQQEELLRNTLSEAQRLNSYIQKLLDMTRLGHGELTLDRDWVGVDDILSVVMKRAKPMAAQVSITIDLQPNLPLLYVHPALIEQALFNVLENAIRFAPPGSVIRVSASTADGQLHIDVHDKGPGIPQAAWGSIFDMFYTLSQGDQYPSGTGLGLAICQGILGAHGGAASVIQSSANSGTTIRLTLPLSTAKLTPASNDDDTHTGD